MKIINRKLNIMLVILVVCLPITFYAIVYFKPESKVDDQKFNKALEKNRQATKEGIESRDKMINQAQAMVFYLKHRDSIMNGSLEKNTSELKKIRDEKKVIDYSKYSDDELQSASSEAARYYRNSQK